MQHPPLACNALFLLQEGDKETWQKRDKLLTLAPSSASHLNRIDDDLA